MADQKFNPIANSQIPPLPEQDVNRDVVVEDPQDATHVADVTSQAQGPQKQIIFEKEETKTQIKTDEEKRNRRKVFMQGIIFVSLIVIILLGIILTLRAMPKLLNNMSGFSKSFESLFVSKDAATNTSASLTATSTTTTTVTKITAPQTIATTTYTQVTPIQAQTKNLKSDLSVKIFSVNTIAGRTSIKFNVQNIGNAPSGSWTFSATLPSTVTPTYYSEIQPSLPAQSGIIYTLGFNPTSNQGNLILIKIFPSSNDANKNNNVTYHYLYY